MATRVVMPKLSDTMTEGKVLKWLKKEGDHVEPGDAIAEVETDKAVLDLEAYGTGVLKKILVPEDEVTPVGELIAVIAKEDEDIEPILKEKHESVEPVKEGIKIITEEEEKEPTKAEEGVTVEREEIKVSPVARRLAKERGVDLSLIKGSGPGGRIVRKDIESYTEPQAMVEKPVEAVEYEDRSLSMMRKAIIANTTKSKAPVPHFYVTIDAGMEKVLELKDAFNESQDEPKVTITDILIRAVCVAVKDFPQINASFLGDRIRYFKGVHMGIAVGLDDGLITPVIRDCHTKDIKTIAREASLLIEKARDRKLAPKEYENATFTISNLGMYPVTEFSAVIYPPQAAILAVGTVRDVPVVRDGSIDIGKRIKLTLSCDHRVVDGLQAARFLERLKSILENPLKLILD